ncbi:hypothetical protein [Nocardia aurea]|uniref:Uncharacterized protein n=1 Tax=Nocardia aurea TaxID=2144174 RepID=A0ABV3G4Y5_9NOCA
MSKTLLVNTSRTVKDGMSEADKLHYTVGIWPFHKGQTLADIEADLDFILGITNGICTVVKKVAGARLTEDGSRFEVIVDSDDDLDDEMAGLLGQRIAPEFAWKPGQGWPVKFFDTQALRDAHQAGPPEVALAGYRLTVDADGTAHLYLPRGGDVHVHAGA